MIDHWVSVALISQCRLPIRRATNVPLKGQFYVPSTGRESLVWLPKSRLSRPAIEVRPRRPESSVDHESWFRMPRPVRSPSW